jgi:hypothetical protein
MERLQSTPQIQEDYGGNPKKVEISQIQRLSYAGHFPIQISKISGDSKSLQVTDYSATSHC